MIIKIIHFSKFSTKSSPNKIELSELIKLYTFSSLSYPLFFAVNLNFLDFIIF